MIDMCRLSAYTSVSFGLSVSSPAGSDPRPLLPTIHLVSKQKDNYLSMQSLKRRQPYTFSRLDASANRHSGMDSSNGLFSIVLHQTRMQHHEESWVHTW